MLADDDTVFLQEPIDFMRQDCYNWDELHPFNSLHSAASVPPAPLAAADAANAHLNPSAGGVENVRPITSTARVPVNGIFPASAADLKTEGSSVH